MPTCPNGHQSGSDDWCEVCGHRMAGAVPPPPPPPPPAAGYGYPPPPPGQNPDFSQPGPGRPHLAAVPDPAPEPELCPQCRTPREANAPFCEECRWNFLTNTATSYTPAAPIRPLPNTQGGPGAPPPRAGRPFQQPPPGGHPGQDAYEYQGSRPSQMNRPAEPIPPFGNGTGNGPGGGPGQGGPGQGGPGQGGPGQTPPGAPQAFQQPGPPPQPGPPAPHAFPQETGASQGPPPPPQPGSGGPSFGGGSGGDDDWVISPPSSPAPPQQPFQRQDVFQPVPPQQQAPQHHAPQQQAPQQQPQHQAPQHQAQQQPQPQQEHPQQQAPQGPGTWTATIGPDREYFRAMMQRSGPEASGLNLPAYSPEQQRPLAGNQITIGRRRHSTGDTPDIDLSVPPEDPGVSHQHAILVQQPDGSWAVVDQNSTNGTTVNGGEEPIQPFVPVPLQDGDQVHVGAWTTITVRRD
ncbi:MULTISPECIES: FHA domain-containing protein [Streptomyces]|uniref:FHA domain-containing protein n=1 Tax=Streptomyces TaxID=1883 RepID=UPI001E337C84|nr:MULTISPECIES: FHA domain-containing protein [Streptomyces]UFQ15719.1 FHA domain-containing protein [Streptomyces huasconensis]WCL85322.1 FHA domain-containing protein [Streptomyces sp. JCM 35825]